MKILTITCHRVYNYGAVLQAYALQQHLKATYEEVEVIDYFPPYVNFNNVRDEIKKNKLVHLIWLISKIPDKRKGEKVFNKFVDNHLRVTQKKYYSYEQLENDPPKGDVYIVGSDQVWNCNMPNGNDDSYFLKFVPNNKIKMSYAASIAMERLNKQQENRIKSLLNDFCAISVREKTGVELLQKVIDKEIINVLDPVYLLDNKSWVEIADYEKSKGNYILVYCFNGQRELIEYANRLGKKHNMKVYIINTRIQDYLLKGDKHFWNISPNQFIGLFDNAQHIVTNSFHGVSFSLIFKKNLHVFTQKGGGNSRLTNILERVGLEERIVCLEKNNLINNEIKYKEVDAKMAGIIEKSKEFLSKSIKEKRGK